MVAVAGLVVGCGVAGGSDDAGQLRPAQTSIPKGTSDPQVKPALEAYQKFTLATVRAQQNPLPNSNAYPARANFTQYSFDPIAAEFESSIKALSLAKSAFRGVPPESHITVTSIDPDAQPWPTVTLSDCQTGQDGWQAFDTRTNKPVPNQEPRIPSPYGAIVTMVYNQQHWGVNSIKMDEDRKC